MPTAVLSRPHSDSEAVEGFVLKGQKAYTFKIAVSMAIYACLFFVLAFCGPYVLPAITLFSNAPLTDRQVAASQLLLLSDTVWVAIPVFFLGAILFSLLVTRRVADALERLGQSARAWASGAISHRLQFRKADGLAELAQLLNQSWTQVAQRVEAIQQELSRARAAVDGAVKIMLAQGAAGSDTFRQLQATTEALDRIHAMLRQFEIESSQATRG